MTDMKRFWKHITKLDIYLNLRKNYPLGMIKEFMKTKGWEFKEQMGSELVFEKDKKTINIVTRQYSKHYYIWGIPKEILN